MVRTRAVTDEGIEVLTTTGDTCGPGTMRSEHILLIAPDGTATVRRSVVVELGDPNCVIGRLTSDVAPPAWASHADLGSYFAEMAALEASAVVAFERLARELLWLGAPSELVARARSGRDDEARHVHQMAELAQVFGAESLGEERLTVAAAEMLELAALPPRSAFDIALENAREGCVRETYGALVATHQAQRATDTRVAETLKHIACDETHGTRPSRGTWRRGSPRSSRRRIARWSLSSAHWPWRALVWRTTAASTPTRRSPLGFRTRRRRGHCIRASTRVSGRSGRFV
jgi:hypothetical protein